MDFDAWLFFSFAIMVATISPGPNILIVIVNATQYGRFGATWTIFGNLTCLFGVALLASLGVGAVIETTPIAYSVMKIAGGIYLAWLGIKLIRSSFGKIGELHFEHGSEEFQPTTRLKLFFEAVAISASNPKSILFLTAIFPQFLDTTAAIVPQFAIMFATIIIIISMVHSFYGFLAVSIGKKPISQFN